MDPGWTVPPSRRQSALILKIRPVAHVTIGNIRGVSDVNRRPVLRRRPRHSSRAYVDQPRSPPGQEDSPGLGRYPEPKWIGMIQHDMMLFDHGMPRPDGTMSKEQRPEADVNLEY